MHKRKALESVIFVALAILDIANLVVYNGIDTHIIANIAVFI